MVDMSSFTRRSNNARELEPVAITTVDPATRTAFGITRVRTRLKINCAFATGDTITTPAVGEQWYVERVDMEWRLYGRIPFNDATLGIEPEEGQVSVGSASGPLELNGTEIRANGRVLRLNGAYYRDSGETLERSEDGVDGWRPIFADSGPGGILAALANKLADIPITPEVEDYLAGLDDDQAQALADLAGWADGLTSGSAWDLCDTGFFADLQTLGEGETPVARIGSGFQNLVNTLFGLLFCQSDPDAEQIDVTPTVLTGALTGLSEVFTGQNRVGDFLRGLQDQITESERANNLLVDAVNGAVSFLDEVFNTLFCGPGSPTQALNPGDILDRLHTVFDPLRDNKFLQGLQELVADTADATGDLIQDAIAGAIKTVRMFFDALFCQWGQDNPGVDFTPQVAFGQINEKIIEPLTALSDSPFITGLRDVAEKMGVAVGHALTDTVQGATEFLQLVVGVVTCNVPQDKLEQLNELISEATGGIFPADLLDFLQNRLIQPLQNSFVQGLAEMFRASTGFTRSLLEDAVAGAEQLLEVIYDIATCNRDGDLVEGIKLLIGPGAVGVTPAKLVGLIDDLFGAFRDNPFVEGLQTFWTTIGNEGSNLAADAIRGAFKFAQFVFDIMLCNPNAADEHLDELVEMGISDTFTPFRILRKLTEFIGHFSNNPFITGLQNLLGALGITGDGHLLKDAVDGAVKLVEFLFDLVTCDFDALKLYNIRELAILDSDFTPAKMVERLDDFFDVFRQNRFLTGLQDIWIYAGNVSRNLLQDAAEGAGKFLEFIWDLLTCNLDRDAINDLRDLADAGEEGDFTPARLIKLIDDFFQPIRENPFVQGLQDIWVRAGNVSRNLIQDGIEGAVQLIRTIVGVLDCEPGRLDDLLTLAGDAEPGSDTPGGVLAALRNMFIGPDGTGGLLGNAWVQILSVIAVRQERTGNLLNNIVDSFSEVLDFIFDGVLGKLFPVLDLRNIIANFPNFTVEHPTMADWLENLRLADLLDPTQLITWFRDNIFNPIFKRVTGVVDETLDFFADPMEHLGTFFTNVRKFFGQGEVPDWDDTFGESGILSVAFQPAQAIESFIRYMIGSTTSTLRALWDVLVGGLTDASHNFVRAITGRPVLDEEGNVIEDPLPGLKALRDFFSGFDFDPDNDDQGILGKLVARITNDDTKFQLSDLADFFDPTSDTNIFANLVRAITERTTDFLAGPIRVLADFFDFDRDTTDSGLTTWLSTIVDTMTSNLTPTGTGPLARLGELFAGVTLAEGQSLLSQLADRVSALGDSLGIKSIVASILGVSPDELDNSYTVTTTGSPTGGTFRLAYGTAVTGFITYSTSASTVAANIESALAALTPAGATGPLGLDKVSVSGAPITGGARFVVSILDDTADLTLSSNNLTGGSSPGVTVVQKFRGPLDTLASFFSGFAGFDGNTGSGGTNLLQQVLSQAGSNIAGLVSRITGVAENLLTAPLDTLQSFFSGFDAFTGGNGILSQLIGRITGGLGTTLGNLQDFFTNLRTFLGFNPTGSFNLSTAVSGFFGTLNNANPATKLNPLNLLANIAIDKITNLVSYLTGTGTTEGNLQTYFTNLRTTLGNPTLLPPGGGVFDANAAKKAIHDVVAGVNSGLTAAQKWATTVLLDAKAAIADLVLRITGASGATDLGPLLTFFAGLGNSGTDAAGTGLVARFVTKITGTTTGTLAALDTVFTNLRAFLNFNPFNGFTNLTSAVNSFFAGLNNLTLSTRLNPAKILADIAIDKITNLVAFITGTGTTENNLQSFFNNLRSLLGGPNLLPSGAFNPNSEIPKLFTVLNNAVSGTLSLIRVVGMEAGNLFDDLQTLFNSVVQGLRGNADATVPTDNRPRLADIFKGAKGTNEAIVALNEAVTLLQTTATNVTNSGKSDYTDFTNFAPFNSGGGLTYGSTVAASSSLVNSGTQAVWNVSGQATRWAQGIFTRTFTDTNSQKIGVAFASAPEANWLNNSNAGFNYILGRSNLAGTEYVYVKFAKNSFSVGFSLAGTNASPSETTFSGGTMTHEFTPGAVYYLECGTESGETFYRVSRNGTPLLTLPGISTYAAYTNASHRYGGFRVQGTSNGLWTGKPGALAAFAIADNAPAAYIGSGFRRFNSSTTATAITRDLSTGYRLLPSNFFNQSSYSTPDYTWTTDATTPNKITVNNPGWYQVTINLGLQINTMETEMATALYRNGTLQARGPSTWGHSFGLNNARGPSGVGGTFIVYLQKNDYIQPGYWQTTLYPNSPGGNFLADSNGVTSHIQVAFLNRSVTN